ncbi:MAG TPA: site-2 protease family protein [Terriglobales bacterium]|nr:site-2 protease family protein [Terriglobales bacterium]
MNPVQIFFEVVAFLFAISVHESAHAWTANRCGDPTARMLGRVTLNPIKHIDLWGTIIFPIICLVTHFPLIGWAKPTPVDPHNMRNPVRDDILTAVAGPVSNLLVAALCVIGMAGVSLSGQYGRQVVQFMAQTYGGAVGMLSGNPSILLPITGMLYWMMFINILLAAFNLIPVPPLDGSHVLRHLMPEGLRRAYDTFGIIALIALFIVGGPVIGAFMSPFLNFFTNILLRL